MNHIFLRLALIRIVLFFSIILLVSSHWLKANAQSIDFYGKKLNLEGVCEGLSFSDKDAKISLDKICTAAGINNNFILVPCSKVDNCQAMVIRNDAYIFYNTSFLQKIKPLAFSEKALPTNNKTDWEAMGIFAHELGHLVNNHFSNAVQGALPRIKLEEQADIFAGSVLQRLGATLLQAQKMMYNNAVSEEASICYGSKKDRLAAVAKGWNTSNSQRGAVSDNPDAPVVIKNKPNNTPTNNNTKNHLGDKTEGGIVFFIDETGLHGLVCSVEDLGKEVAWDPEALDGNGNYQPTKTNANSVSYGGGVNNTDKIIAALGKSRSAATICKNYNGGGFADWYLPSKEELSLLYQNKAAVKNLSDGYYWSSTEYNNFETTSAWYQSLGNGQQSYANKNVKNSIRAIRAF